MKYFLKKSLEFFIDFFEICLSTFILFGITIYILVTILKYFQNYILFDEPIGFFILVIVPVQYCLIVTFFRWLYNYLHTIKYGLISRRTLYLYLSLLICYYIGIVFVTINFYLTVDRPEQLLPCDSSSVDYEITTYYAGYFLYYSFGSIIISIIADKIIGKSYLLK